MQRSPSTLLLAVSATALLTACATMGPPQPPSLELPKPPSDVRAVRKGERVILSWTAPSVTTDRQRIRNLGGTRICRGLEAKLMQCGVPVGEAAAPKNSGLTQSKSSQSNLSRPSSPQPSKQKVAGSYTDSLSAQLESDNPADFVTYAVEVLNADGRGAGLSNQVRVSLGRTLPAPRDFAARVTGQGVVLTWTGDFPPADSTKPVRWVYRVYRHPEGSSQQIVAGEVPAGSERNGTFTDSNIEWEKTYEYHVETVTVMSREKEPELQIEGDDSPEVKVFTNDVFPPAVPSGLQAVFSGPGQKTFIDLVWAPVTDVDLDGYNVYRHEEGTAAVKVNTEPVKTPAYRDANVASGKHYFYSVSAVDARGNESARSEEAGESVP